MGPWSHRSSTPGLREAAAAARASGERAVVARRRLRFHAMYNGGIKIDDSLLSVVLHE
jgi:hypothetical protein